VKIVVMTTTVYISSPFFLVILVFTCDDHIFIQKKMIVLRT